MDQALEKQYNKPAKGQSEIIGFSRRKEAVCKWSIVKHEKSQYTSSLEKVCDIINEGEYSIHHEFSMSRTETDVSAVNRMMDYIKSRGNPFEDSNPLPRNFKTGELMGEPLAKSLIRAVETGEREYSVFKDKRLETKSIKLCDTIQNVKLQEKQCSAKKPPDVNKETLSFLCTIDIARRREYDLQVLLQYDITSCSFYLTKDGNLRKSPKSDLATELKRSLATIPNDVPSSAADSVIIFDFMAYSRKVPVKKIKLQTFEDLNISFQHSNGFQLDVKESTLCLTYIWIPVSNSMNVKEDRRNINRQKQSLQASNKLSQLNLKVFGVHQVIRCSFNNHSLIGW